MTKEKSGWKGPKRGRAAGDTTSPDRKRPRADAAELPASQARLGMIGIALKALRKGPVLVAHRTRASERALDIQQASLKELE